MLPSRQFPRLQGLALASLALLRSSGTHKLLSIALCLAWPLPAMARPIIEAERNNGRTLIAETNPAQVFELPKLTIEGAPDYPLPEDWLYAELAGFEVLSSLSARETSRLLKNFQLLRLAVEVALPELQPSPGGPPAVLVICGRGGDFRRFLPANQADDSYRTDHLLLETGARRALVINAALARLDLDGMSDSPPATTAPPFEDDADDPGTGTEIGATVETNPYQALRRAYFRQRLRGHTGGARLPWLEEGLVQLCAAIEYRPDLIVLGQVGDSGGGERPGAFNTVLRQRALVPMAEFFAGDKAGSDLIWSAQAYAFVHYFLHGGDSHRREQFARFVAAAAGGPVTEEMTRRHLGLDYRQLGLELRAHVDFTAYRHTEFRARRGGGLPRPPAITVQPAKDADAGRLVGEVLLLGGHPVQARWVLQAAVSRGESDPRLLATAGRALVETGEPAGGFKVLERAVAARVDRSDAYLLLARQRQSALPPPPAGGWPATVLAPVTEPLEAACRQAPPDAEVFTLLADWWLRCADAPTRETLGRLNAGVLQFPRHAGLVVRAAELNRRHGDPAEAREIVRYGLATFTQPAVRAALEAVARQLPASESSR
jgi:hypothetical protein